MINTQVHYHLLPNRKISINNNLWLVGDECTVSFASNGFDVSTEQLNLR